MTGNWFRKLHPKRSAMEEKAKLQPKKKKDKSKKPKAKQEKPAVPTASAASSFESLGNFQTMEPQYMMPTTVLLALLSLCMMLTNSPFFVGLFMAKRESFALKLYHFASKYIMIATIVNIIRVWEWIWTLKLVIWPTSNWIGRKLYSYAVTILLAFFLSSFGTKLYMAEQNGKNWYCFVGKNHFAVHGTWCESFELGVIKTFGNSCPFITIVQYFGMTMKRFSEIDAFRMHVTAIIILIFGVCSLISNIIQSVCKRIYKGPKDAQKHKNAIAGSMKKVSKTPAAINSSEEELSVHSGEGDNASISGSVVSANAKDERGTKTVTFESKPGTTIGENFENTSPGGQKKKRRARVRRAD